MVQSVMNPDVLITSCVDVPDVRVIRVNHSFYISLEDDLMRLFGSEKSDGTYSIHWELENGEQIEHKMLIECNRKSTEEDRERTILVSVRIC